MQRGKKYDVDVLKKQPQQQILTITAKFGPDLKYIYLYLGI